MSIPINDTLVPRTTGYKLVDSDNVAGSLQEVADIAARDAIPTYNLKVGMLVYTLFEDKYWKCTDTGIPTWEEFNSGGGGGGTVTSIVIGTGLASTQSPLTTTGTLSLADTTVVPGSYTSANITVDQQGRITTVANGSFSSFSFAALVGTWNQGVLSQDSTDANFLSYVPNTVGTTSWYQWAGEFSNGAGHRPNEVMTFGWNQSAGGSRQSTGLFDGALWSQYEQYFEAVGGNKVMERHEVYVDPSDQQTRYISFSGGLDSPSYSTSLFLTSQSVLLGFGHNPADMVRQIELTSTASVFRGTDTIGNVYIDPSQSWISAGNGSGYNLARLTCYPAPGQMYANAYYAGYLTSGGSNTQYLSWGPGAGTQLILAGDGIPIVAPGADATSGSQLQNSGILRLQAHYWNGAASTLWNGEIRTEMDSTSGPLASMNFLLGNTSEMKLSNLGGGLDRLLFGQASFQLYNVGQTDGFNVQANSMRIDSAGVGVAYFQGGLTRIIPGSNNAFDLGASGSVWKSSWNYRNAGVEQTVPAAASITLDPAGGEYIRVTLSATAVTAITSTAGYPDEIMTVAIIQDGTGGRSLSGWDSSFVFLNGAYTPSSAINARDILVWKWDAIASKWYEQSRTGATVPLRKANASETQLTTTGATDVLDFTTTNAGNYIVYCYWRVITGTTNLTLNVTYTDVTGGTTQTIVPAATPQLIGSYISTPVYINATNSTHIKLTATASVANQIFISGSIVGIT